MTSMRRHGLAAAEVHRRWRRLLAGVRLEGLAFHLPMDRHGGYDPAAEVVEWLRAVHRCRRTDRTRRGSAT